MKLALGTVQFGIPYGVANSTGQVLESEVLSILNHAKSLSMDTLDTAIAYGESENCLGRVGVTDWNVITKLPEIPNNCPNLAEWIRASLQCSLNRLGISKVSALLLHRSSQLLDADKADLWPTLLQLKIEGLVDKIGVSIYTPEELTPLWPLFKLDLIQAPYNIFDRSLVESGWLQTMHINAVEVHVRSIFLQGLLFMSSRTRPKKFARFQPLFDRWDGWLKDNRISALQACILFALSEPRISRVVVGVDSLDQLKEISTATVDRQIDFPADIYSTDQKLINPSNWSSL
jgi:aryl-alcohol dehydrogenase-like predicted oxidoreductase